MDFFTLMPEFYSTPLAASYVAASVVFKQLSNHKPLNFPYTMFLYNAIAIGLSFTTASIFLYSMTVSTKYLDLGLQLS